MTRRQALLIAGCAVSLLLLWLALREVPLDALADSLRTASPIWILPFLLALAIFCWLKALRWAKLLQPVCATSARQLLSPVVIGYMGTGLLPMQLGEIARAYLASLQLRARMAPVLASLLVERVFDVLSLLLVVGIVCATHADVQPQLRTAGVICLALGAIALLVLWLYGTRTDSFVAFMRSLAKPLPERLRSYLLEQLQLGASGVQALRRPATYVQISVLSLAQWACMGACVWISLAAVGQHLSVLAALAVLATTIVAMTLPAGPGYVGSLQLAFVVALGPFDVARSEAVAASFIYLALLWIPLVAGGLFLLHRTGLRLHDLQQAQQAPTQS